MSWLAFAALVSTGISATAMGMYWMEGRYFNMSRGFSLAGYILVNIFAFLYPVRPLPSDFWSFLGIIVGWFLVVEAISATRVYKRLQ